LKESSSYLPSTSTEPLQTGAVDAMIPVIGRELVIVTVKQVNQPFVLTQF
jgi:hypothetical protein